MNFAGFSKNLKTGFAEGLKLTEAGLEKGATRQLNKAQDELAEYLLYDPDTDTGGATSNAPNKPTQRDLLATRTAYQEKYAAAQARLGKAKRMANDVEWSSKADAQWANDISKGFQKYANQAAAAIERGDMDAAERALNHADGLMPSGGASTFKRNKDGNFEMTSVDEVTGEIIEKRIVTPQDIRILAAAAGDPAKFLDLTNKQSLLTLKRREQAAREAKQVSDNALNLAQMEKLIAEAANQGAQGVYWKAAGHNLRQDQFYFKQDQDFRSFIDKAIKDGDLQDLKMSITDPDAVQALSMQLYINAGRTRNYQQVVSSAKSILRRVEQGDPAAIQMYHDLLGATAKAVKPDVPGGQSGIPNMTGIPVE